MIQANELRIGNMVYESFSFNPTLEDLEIVTIHKIDSLNGIYSDIHDNLGDFDSLYPIPLTPEIIQMCGFKLDEHYKTYFVTDEQNNDWSIVVNSFEESKGYLFQNSKSDASCYSVAYVKYLHQLQNLYFALTGEELQLLPQSCSTI